MKSSKIQNFEKELDRITKMKNDDEKLFLIKKLKNELIEYIINSDVKTEEEIFYIDVFKKLFSIN